MQIARTPVLTTPATTPNPLQLVGTTKGGTVEVFAGKAVRTGITDIQAAGRELLGEYFYRGGDRQAFAGSVGFLRNGDAWDAVELLVRPNADAAPARTWLTTPLSVQPGVALDGVWLLADYGGDWSRIIQPAGA